MCNCSILKKTNELNILRYSFSYQCKEVSLYCKMCSKLTNAFFHEEPPFTINRVSYSECHSCHQYGIYFGEDYIKEIFLVENTILLDASYSDNFSIITNKYGDVKVIKIPKFSFNSNNLKDKLKTYVLLS